MPMTMETYTKVRVMARARGVTLGAIADKLGVTPSTISYVINNNPTISYLAKIANVLGVPLKDLIR